MSNALTGLAGEYYVLAQLAHRNLVATMTLSNTKGVDILVTNQELNKLFKVEVKTTKSKPGKSSLFGDGKYYKWVMNKNNEDARQSNLFYCFVALQGYEELPRIFVVPSNYVGDYLKSQHKIWLNAPRDNPVRDTSMRNFRIDEQDPEGFQNNWEVFLS